MPKTLLTIVILFGAIFTAIFYIRPEWARFNSLRAKNAYLQSISAELDEIIASKDALFAAVNAISKEDLERLTSTFPQGQDASRFLVFIGTAAQNNNLKLEQIDISGTSAGAGGKTAGSQPTPGGNASLQSEKEIKELPFSLGLSGSYQSFKSFLQDMEKNARIIDAQSISFTSTDSQTGSGVDFSVKMKTYYQ